jgi:hypothetical protein
VKNTLGHQTAESWQDAPKYPKWPSANLEGVRIDSFKGIENLKPLIRQGWAKRVSVALTRSFSPLRD